MSTSGPIDEISATMAEAVYTIDTNGYMGAEALIELNNFGLSLLTSHGLDGREFYS